MANELEYAQVLQNELDRQTVQQATSGWMERNAGAVRYMGGSEVRLPVSGMTGLGNYDRETGKYPMGAITLEYETKRLMQDRAAQFYFDRNDVDETNYLIEAAAVMSQFQQAHVIPEIDAYRYSELARAAIAAGNKCEETLTENEVLKRILSELRRIQDKTGICKTEFVITVPFSVFELLEQSTELTRILQTQAFERGDVQTEVNSINGVPVIAVSGDRMKTKYVFNSGETKFGFEPAGDAKDINFIIAAKYAPIAVSKTDALKIFSPEQNQDGDGWKTQYRKYHDLWIREKDLASVFVSVKED